jgi:hypothetical protein
MQELWVEVVLYDISKVVKRDQAHHLAAYNTAILRRIRVGMIVRI